MASIGTDIDVITKKFTPLKSWNKLLTFLEKTQNVSNKMIKWMGKNIIYSFKINQFSEKFIYVLSHYLSLKLKQNVAFKLWLTNKSFNNLRLLINQDRQLGEIIFLILNTDNNTLSIFGLFFKNPSITTINEKYDGGWSDYNSSNERNYILNLLKF